MRSLIAAVAALVITAVFYFQPERVTITGDGVPSLAVEEPARSVRLTNVDPGLDCVGTRTINSSGMTCSSVGTGRVVFSTTPTLTAPVSGASGYIVTVGSGGGGGSGSVQLR